MNLASLARTRASRRGVVLVVILGMLGLLALIGVTFATVSNQAQINARNFMQAQVFPDASEMLDYALSQLIDDTANPASVIRGLIPTAGRTGARSGEAFSRSSVRT